MNPQQHFALSHLIVFVWPHIAVLAVAPLVYRHNNTTAVL
jgi:hypothetical protein